MPVDGILNMDDDGRVVMNLKEKNEKPVIKKTGKVYSDGRGRIYEQLEFDFEEEQVAPI